MSIDVDFLVIGSGLAGLTYALNVAQIGTVALLTKRTRSDANSSWAQGGIAGVMADDDSFELHKQDTLIAGAGLCREDAVEILVSEGPERIHELIAMGASFNTETDEQGNEVLSLGREGGHSRNRIVHTADYTGWECERTLLEAVRRQPAIRVYEHFFVKDLIIESLASPSATDGHPRRSRCIGAVVIHSATGELETFHAKATLLATGGCGHVYQHTTNPLVATGDGVAMAWRAGAAISNMEFIQFHPTTLYHPEARAFLITEALRGEGGILKHADGELFMERYHPLRELAPRDIVARAIISEIKRRESPCVYLDVTHLDEHLLKTHFPTVYERCLSVGIDITQVPIPIVPAQHYQCGGVFTDLNGATTIQNLYAAGEVACTGVHGANRLASNSLLEALVFGYRAAKQTLLQCENPTPRFSNCSSNLSLSVPVPIERVDEMEDTLSCDSSPYPIKMPKETLDHSRIQEIRRTIVRTMQREVGIMRSITELEHALHLILPIETELANGRLETVEAFETFNIATVARIIVQSALLRKESRGLHYVRDFPESIEAERHDTVIIRH